MLDSEFINKDRNRIYQGDIFTEIEYKIISRTESGLSATIINYPYAVVLTQDCDLEQDVSNRNAPSENRNNEDKYIHDVLLCPAFVAEQLRAGEHLESLGIKGQIWNSDLWKHMKRNENKRFHFLKKDQTKKINDIILDFKQYFTLSRDELYTHKDTKYLTSIRDMFREDLSLRFAQYLSRIGLPIINSQICEES